MQKLYRTTLAFLKLFKDTCQQQRLPLLLLYQPMSFETETVAEKDIQYPKKVVMNYTINFLYPSEKLRGFAQKNSILFLDPILKFVRFYHRTGHLPYIPNNGHYNEQGHAIVAQALYDYLLQHKLVPVKNPNTR